jgi:hypothetical protein
MTVLITLTAAGADTGPFNLYSDTNYATPFTSSISRASLISGFTATGVPDGTTIIRATSTGNCTNSVNITIQQPCECYYFDVYVAESDLQAADDETVRFSYVDCNGDLQTNYQNNTGTYTNQYCGTLTNAVSITVGGMEQAAADSNATMTTTTCCPVYYPFVDSKYSTISHATVCTRPTTTLYSNCAAPEGESGCYIYTDNQGTLLTGNPYIYLDPFGNYDISPQTGEIVQFAVEGNQCP